MAQHALQTDEYTLYPSPRNEHRVVFAHHAFVAHPYALIDLPAMALAGRYSLFAAHRKADGKMGQLATFELERDRAVFEREFVAD